jgi:hypothetical protein
MADIPVPQGGTFVPGAEKARMAQMLFTLKEVVNDCDDTAVKSDVMNYLRAANTVDTSVDSSACIKYIKDIAALVKPSFEARSSQAQYDNAIIESLNRRIDDFRKMHNSRVARLIAEITEIVEDEVETAKREIIKKLDPYGIKERFPKKSDFGIWIEQFNANYKALMSNSVNRKVQNMMRTYVSEADIVSNNINALIAERQIVLDKHDRFYASVADGKLAIVNETKAVVTQMSHYNVSLSQASEEMFYEIWQARQKYDIARYGVAGVAAIAGGIGAGLAASAVTSAAAAALTGAIGTVAAGAATAMGAGTAAAAGIGSAAAAGATIAGVGAVSAIIPITIGLVGAAAVGFLALELSSSVFGIGMEKKVRESQKKFIAEVDRSALEMKDQLKQSIFALFEQEFKSLEQNFYQFRTATYIDVNKTLELKEKFNSLERELAIYE